MRHMVSALLAGAVFFGSISAANAAPITAKEARRALFKGSRLTVELLDMSALEAATRAQAEAVATSLNSPEIAAQWAAMGFAMGYYGAMAVMPDRPLSPQSMAISNNLHSPAAARAAALAACNALEGPDCVAVALILPKRYRARDFTLSQAATEAFRDSWGRAEGPQYLAYSASTGAFVIAKGPGADQAALQSCNTQAGNGDSGDCLIGIADE